MAMLPIATTRHRDFQPLGTAGQTAIELWGVLSALLARELSPAHAALLAEPVENAARGEIDWYTSSDGPAIALTLADPAAAAAVIAERSRLEQDIRTLAERRRASTNESESFLGEMLLLALSVPSDEHVYLLGGQPVLVCWGHAPAGGVPKAATLVGYRSGAPTPMTILPPPILPVVASTLRRWLLPLLLVSLLLPLLALLLLLLDPYGWFAVAGPECRIADGQSARLAERPEPAARGSVLRAELAQVTDAAGRRRLQCPATRVQAPPAGQAVMPPSNDIQRAERRGAHTGKLQLILTWEDRNDLDLHVLCPNGGQIYYDSRDACGGHLDVDANGDARTATATPVENVYLDDPPAGRYRIIVEPYAMRVGTDSHFRVTIRREGQPDKVVEGTAHNGEYNQMVADVQVPW